MKPRPLVALLSLMVMALPLLAQNTSASADQSASADHMTATGQPPLQTSKPTDYWDGDQPGLAWLVLHPFASKAYVRRHVQSVQDRVNELDELSASNANAVKDVDTRAQHGIQLVSDKANLADQHALDASTKAQTAQQTATAANTRATTVEGVVGNIDQYKSTNQTVIRFHSGQGALSKQAKDALDEMASQLKDQHGYVIEVQGFAPGSGQAAIASSQRMADAVVRYLVLNHEIPAYRIYRLALGNTPTTAEDGKRVSGSRVEVSLLKNDLDQLASTTSK